MCIANFNFLNYFKSFIATTGLQEVRSLMDLTMMIMAMIMTMMKMDDNHIAKI
jgi:hypothetical protein